MTDTSLMDKNNSAGRFLKIFHKAKGFANEASILMVWARVFDLNKGMPALEINHEVSVLLAAANNELAGMDAALISFGTPEGLVRPYIRKAREAFSTSIVNNRWDIANQYITTDVMLAFEWFSHLLDEDSSIAKHEDIQEIFSEIRELELIIANGHVDKILADFISSHLATIQSALLQTPISGIKPLQQAIRSTLTNLELDKENLQRAAAQSGNPTTINKAGHLLGTIWKKGAEISGDIEKYTKAGKLLGEGGSAVIGFISQSF